MIPKDCRAWLCDHHEGSLSYLSGRGPRSVVVSYAVVDDHILLQVPDYNEIAHYAPGAQVSLDIADGPEATEADPPGPAIDAVRVSGMAQLSPESEVPCEKSFEESWPDGIKTSIVSLPLTDLDVRQAPAEP